MAIALREIGLHVECERRVTVYFRGQVVGAYVADQIVEDLVVLEFKAARAVDPGHEAQCLNLLKATKYEVALLLSFGRNADFKRFVAGNVGKHAVGPLPDPPTSPPSVVTQPPAT